MALVVNDLADAINKAIGAKDANGQATPTTPQMKAYAQAIIDTIKAGLINRVGAPGAPLSNGTATGGLILGLVPAIWIGDIVSGSPTAKPAAIADEATASTSYLMASSLINFQTGNIKGSCTATPTSPGILAAGNGAEGKIEGLDGSAWANAVVGVTPGANPDLTTKIYKAVVDYLKSKATATYASGTIVGTFSAGGGPLIAGAGIGGTIS